MAKLSDAQIKALEQMRKDYVGYGVRFATGEALRRMGLADRYTETVIRCEYHTADSVTPQRWCSEAAPAEKHEWYITKKGRAALQEAGR